MRDIYVSIICNVYNHAAFLKETLDGFLSQKTQYSFEVLIHDDASTDNSAEIIKEYEERYPEIIKPIYQEDNKYSKGIDIICTYQMPRAKGKYIAFCEGDDFWCDSNKLETQVSFLEEHQEYSGCVHETRIIGENNRELGYCYNEKMDKDILTLDSMLTFPHTTSYLFRNPWSFENDEMKELTRYISPWDKTYAIYMVKIGKVRYFSKVMSCYRYITTTGTSFQSKAAKTNLTKLKAGAELSHYYQIKAYGLKIDIMPHYFRNVCDYAIGKYIQSPTKENKDMVTYAFEQSPYTVSQYMFYRLKLIPKELVYLPIRVLKKIYKMAFESVRK